MLLSFSARKKIWPQALTDRLHPPHSPSKPFSLTPQAEWFRFVPVRSHGDKEGVGLVGHQGVGRRLTGLSGDGKKTQCRSNQVKH